MEQIKGKSAYLCLFLLPLLESNILTTSFNLFFFFWAQFLDVKQEGVPIRRIVSVREAMKKKTLKNQFCRPYEAAHIHVRLLLPQAFFHLPEDFSHFAQLLLEIFFSLVALKSKKN